MWKHVLLLGLALERGLGGLGLWGRLGAPIFSPTGIGIKALFDIVYPHFRNYISKVHKGKNLKKWKMRKS